jgi:RHH-type proline utilization regulon transcriptional repressor/proline dehydrogenase/delta 1-pyrroline-5-carboxylate dehydrogenase
MLTGAMDELVIGDPASLATDIGPLIDASAKEKLDFHASRLRAEGRVLHEGVLPAGLEGGHFLAPLLAEIPAMSYLTGEIFGPILHLLRFRIEALDELVDALNATGYGLTLGIHSRIEGHVRRIVERARVGNVYINRNQIGAVVGMQPFGGEGLSGTGFKAGGPHYLLRFVTERTVSVNTAAVGGNAALLGEGESA